MVNVDEKLMKKATAHYLTMMLNNWKALFNTFDRQHLTPMKNDMIVLGIFKDFRPEVLELYEASTRLFNKLHAKIVEKDEEEKKDEA